MDKNSMNLSKNGSPLTGSWIVESMLVIIENAYLCVKNCTADDEEMPCDLWVKK